MKKWGLAVVVSLISVGFLCAQAPLRGEVMVESGTFQMGSPSGGDNNERPVTTVRLDSYYLSPYEVTFEEYDAFAAATGRGLPDDIGWGRAARSVISINWFDMVAYCNWLSAKDGLAPAYQVSGTTVTWNRTANGWRLPTEAEWEYAARGGPRAIETIYAGSDDPNEVAWYGQDTRTMPVGQKKPNELGLYDMSGNVAEWVWDRYARALPGGAQENPSGPEKGSSRVIRGGSWFTNAERLTLTTRTMESPDYVASATYGSVGFRIARSAPQ
jgi:formylglycine-generating enzyme required for sulfatase activity